MIPAVYRGTFFGTSAAVGKIGAVVVCVIVTHTVQRDKLFGMRLVVFISLMIAAAVLSWYLLQVQMRTKASCVGGALEND